jgi:hypothetical protein
MENTKSGPVSMQPSGPVPKPDSTASGSGPSTSLPANLAEALAAWNRVLALLEERRRFSLLGPFQHARVLKWTADEVALGFPVEVHSMGEMANDRANLDELGAIVRELFGANMSAAARVSVRLLDDAESSSAGARSILETTREKTTAERGKRETEAREHPITKHVLQTFGAQIKEIKTDV